MNVAILENLQADSAHLRESLAEYCHMGQFYADIEEFTSGEALMESFEKDKYQIIFIDIFLASGMDGIETARKIREIDKETYIVFVTISREHALPGVGVGMIDYIVKPISKESLAEAMFRCRAQLKRHAKTITVSVNRQPMEIQLRHIYYAEILDKNVILHTSSHGEVRTRMTLGELADLLEMNKQTDAESTGDEAPIFILCYRSYVVNLSNTTDMRDNSFIMKNGSVVPISRTYAAQSQQAFNRHLLYAMD